MSRSLSELNIYDAVTVNVGDEKILGVLTDVGYDTDRYVFEVSTRRGTYRGLSREEITFSHHLESPFEFGSEVQVFPRDPSLSYLNGARGIVVGKAFSPDTGAWGFAIRLAEKDVWSFEADELVPGQIPRMLP